MFIGLCTIHLSMDNVYSLKEKRQIIASILGKLKSKFNISIAEITQNDIHKNSIIGFSCVSNTSKHVQSVLNNVLNFVDNYCVAEILDVQQEIISFSGDNY
jgi:uncharacterized protein YlxP (DUF503 family)